MEKKKNLSASVRAKLTNKARAKGEEMQNLLMRFAAERFLYRISRSEYKDRFLLKGAALFSLWFDEPHRPTKDLDLLGRGETSVPALEQVMREICLIDGEDGLEFLPASVKGTIIREEEIYGGVRLNLLAMLEKARIPVQVDVGAGDKVTPEATEETLPAIIEELPAPRIKVYPKETVIAEKFEAMVKLGLANSRMKDFWDISYLLKEFEFQGEIIQKAINATFSTRGTLLPLNLPVALTDEFAADPLIASRWTAFIKRNRITTETELVVLIGNLREFFAPVLQAIGQNNVFEALWSSRGQWGGESDK